MNFLVSITGPSGVGKTTIANLFLSTSKYNSSTIVSGDDAHKWIRNSKNWQRYTHLNPEANNLSNDYEQLLLLKNNNSIERSHYNHNNGLFDEPTKIYPKKLIVYEGLHALYTEEIRNISDLKIYVDTDEELKIAWKIKRDLNKRGYSEEQILETIKRRMNDEKEFILPQKKFADVVVKFTFDESEGVMFEYYCNNDKYLNLFQKIKNFYELKKQFITVCKILNQDEELIQNKGGNVSVKYDDKMLITSSGHELKKVSVFEGLCIVEINDINNVIFNYGRPSMEALAHSVFNKATIHTHPTHLLAILCSRESEELIRKLYKNYDFNYVKYTSPGNNLYNEIKKSNNNIVFCENHGLFVSSDDLYKSYYLTKELNQIAKQFITENIINSGILNCSEPLFPDSVVLTEANKELNDNIYTTIINCNLIPKFLNKKEIEYILNMEEEKYRSKK
jgi:uridine kinase/ribulose-5-phosphate 4-epimerase/fuculose-1-phosphate aldolase